MVLNILIIVLVGVVAFYHYTQGFFSATLSAIMVVFSAVMAVSYNETVIHLLNHGSLEDSSHAMALVGIFAITYTLLRVIFDKFIPGNVRTPATVDKIGAGLMGLIAGLFAAGIIAVAVQLLPFNPSLGFMGFKRYPMTDSENVSVPKPDKQPFDESPVNDRLDDPTFASPDKPRNALWVPADDILMWTSYKLSDGALPGARPLESIHPAYLDELFAEKLGIQTGAYRSALQFKGNESVTVDGVFEIPPEKTLTGYDAEMPPTRDKAPVTAEAAGVAKKVDAPKVPDSATREEKEKAKNAPVKWDVKSTKAKPLLIVRVGLTDKASADEDNAFRFSCGSIRLVGKNPDGTYVDYHPIGTMQPSDDPRGMILLNAPDDFLFVNLKERNGVDLVFAVDSDNIEGGKSPTLADGTFISIKRFANIDLSGMKVSTSYATDNKYIVTRKKTVEQFLNLPAVKAQGDTGDDKKK